MIQVAVSWIYILLLTILWGFLVSKLVMLLTGAKKIFSIELVMLLGIAFLTAYAESVSLVTRVSDKAYKLALGIGVLGLILCWKEIVNTVKQIRSSHNLIFNIIIVLGLAVLFIAISSTKVITYDTGLYHAQSVRWIEEYGLVKGLGNLHHRFAYNNSFFSLQALFSMRWKLRASVRNMNGFLSWLLTSWAVCSFLARKEKSIKISDLMRLLLVYFLLVNNITNISSCSSDVFVLSLIIYIITKWMEVEDNDAYCLEGNGNELNGMAANATYCMKTDINDTYCMLVILGVYAVTLKLSAAMVVLLVIAPIIYLIKNKQYKNIAIYILMGMALVVPFLLRNIVISGYLLYPYPSIDLFPVDWKMNPYTCAVEAAEIKLWGRGLNDLSKIGTPFFEWFPAWLKGIAIEQKIMLVLDIVCLPFVCKKVIKGLKKDSSEKSYEATNELGYEQTYEATHENTQKHIHKKPNKTIRINVDEIIYTSVIPLTTYMCLLFWFLTAPMPRFGEIYIPLCLLGAGFMLIPKTEYITKVGHIIVSLLLALCIFNGIRYISDEEVNLDKQPGIWAVESEKIPFGLCEEIYIPVNTGEDKLGYDAFPSTPYPEMLDRIELYGATAESGFRLKDEYKNALLSVDGEIHEKSIFE